MLGTAVDTKDRAMNFKKALKLNAVLKKNVAYLYVVMQKGI